MIDQLSNSWWVFVILGICAGILSGTLGIGSGIIFVPGLVLLCNLGQKNAQGMALAIMVPMAFVGALQYWRNPEVEMNTVIIGLTICGAVVGVVIGAEFAALLPSHILRKVFAAVLVIVAIKMFMASAKPGQPNLDNSLIEQKVVSSLEHGETNNEPEI